MICCPFSHEQNRGKLGTNYITIMYSIMYFFNTYVEDLAEKCSEKKQLVYNPLPHWIFVMGKKVCKQKQNNKQVTKSANETKTTKKELK